MRTTASVLAALGALLLTTACDGDTPSELDTSRDEWEEAAAGHAYTYVERDPWAGETTTVTVDANGGVVSRAFVGPTGETWTESGDQIGTHSAGFPALSFDQVYDLCEDEYLTKDRELYDVTFEVDERGFLDTCGYDEPDCEDCFVGIQIQSVELASSCFDGDC